MSTETPTQKPANATAILVLDDGSHYWGRGFGAQGVSAGEICFNTAMSGYQEILTDPSYAGQIINFTFPHIGNCGVNDADMESPSPAARGMIVHEDAGAPSNWRAVATLDAWLKDHNLPAIGGVDTRALARRIRDQGAPNGVLCHNADGVFDLPALIAQAKDWPGLDGMDLAASVSCKHPYQWNQTRWDADHGYGTLEAPRYHVVAVDFGIKHNILRCLAQAGCRVTVVPANSRADEILAHAPDGVFLSNGPGDPAATGVYAVPMIRDLLAKNIPIFGICLGHQMLARALGADTHKMHLGHRGANHPVQDIETGRVEITSQNHGFCVVPESLPSHVAVTHTSLFDGSNEGLRVLDKPVFSVQYHPEASPGPQDSHYLFERFTTYMDAHKKAA